MSLISPFDPWRSELCNCPPKYSLSPYTGCGHGCLYCYASSYIPNFYQPRPKKDFLKRIRKELEKVSPFTYLAISNSSDPFQPLERRENLTKSLLKILSQHDLRIMIVTKSDFILENVNLIEAQQSVVIAITLTTLNQKIAEKLEPEAPSPFRRLQAIASLSQYFPVVCRFDPLIYPLNTEEIRQVIQAVKEAGARQIITSTFKARPDSLKRMAKEFPHHSFLWQELYLEKGQNTARYYYLPKSLRQTLIEKVREETLKAGLAFSSCREGLPELNTAICDGSSYFLEHKMEKNIKR